jgi:Common central domain of tyrosinase/Bacterial Ig domain
MIGRRSGSRSIAFLLSVLLTTSGLRAEDLYIRDDLADTGVEINPNTGPMWTSPDIWVRNDPMPGWNPYPYSIPTPTSPAPLWLDTTHFNPDYRSPLSGRPNYVYVRVRNRGTASTGSERLTLYWAAASTGLAWDPTKVGGSFIDNLVGNVLFGGEITKVRKNAATASPAERTAYVNAILAIADQANPAVIFPGGDTYWHTQQEIHRFGPPFRHGANNSTNTAFIPSVAFLPWHREFVNRYEGLLQEANPAVKLLYWQWTQNPHTTLMTPTFMGNSGQGQPAGVQIGPPLSPATDGVYPNTFTGLNPILRRLQPTVGTIESDTAIHNRTDYDSTANATNFSGRLEAISHNSSHVRVAGDWNPPGGGNPALWGDQLLQNYAARDPFFFLLHAKVDQLWARWQRKSNFNLDPATTYGSAQTDANLAATMSPWDGVAYPDGFPNDSPGELEPWTATGGHIYAKTSLDRSVTSPPFYDIAPLTIPALQPNQEVILEIPWYPPNPANFSGVGDPLHACLIARIETSTAFPFGMTTAETADINANTRANNNIAWRNVSVVDSFPGPLKKVTFLARNTFAQPVAATLRLAARLDRPGDEFFRLGTVRVDLGRELMARWRNSGGRGRGIERTENPTELRLTQADATLESIELRPGETFSLRLAFELGRDYRPTKPGEIVQFDIVQTGAPGAPQQIVGGNRYQIAVQKLTLVPRGREWRLFGATKAPHNWNALEFDDSDWHRRRLELGLIDPAACGPHGVKSVTTYLRHTFEVADPSFFRNVVLRLRYSDGAAVYLNGKEIFRANLPAGRLDHRSLAAKKVRGIAKDAYFLAKIEPERLRSGKNVLAVEVHRATDNRAELTFDAELNANWEQPLEGAVAAFTNTEGALFSAHKRTAVEVEAFDTDGLVRSVSLMMDGKPVATTERPPFRFEIDVREGPQRLSAVVMDSDGNRSLVHTTVTGVKNIPPKVTITQPGLHSEITAGDTFVAVARASDPDGSIRRVDFFLNDTVRFNDPPKLVGSMASPPYVLTLHGLKPGHNMIRAVAHDDGGARTSAIPIMVIVRGDGEEHGGH